MFFNIGNKSCNASTWCGGGSRKKFSTTCSAEAAKSRGAPTSPSRRIRSTAPRFAGLTAPRTLVCLADHTNGIWHADQLTHDVKRSQDSEGNSHIHILTCNSRGTALTSSLRFRFGPVVYFFLGDWRIGKEFMIIRLLVF